MNLAQYSLDNTKIVYFFLAVLLIGGILSFGRLGKKEDAPFVIKSAVIMTRYPGAEPAEVERLPRNTVDERRLQDKVRVHVRTLQDNLRTATVTLCRIHSAEVGRTAAQSAQHTAPTARRLFCADRLG